MEEKIIDAKRLLSENGYVVKKITKQMEADCNKCEEMEERGESMDCGCCSCSICCMQ